MPFSSILAKKIIFLERAKILAVIALCLITNEFLFSWAEKRESKISTKAIESLLQRETLIFNPYLLDQALGDLEHLDVIRCIYLHPPENTRADHFLDHRRSPSCLKINPLSSKIMARKLIRAGNGEIWQIEYQYIPGVAYDLALWLTRILIISVILIGALWLRSRDKFRNSLLLAKENMADERANLASQVAHDIRSPLAALEAITSDLSLLAEEKRIVIRSAVGRIKDIAQGLLERNPINTHKTETQVDGVTTTEKSSVQLLPALLEALITEKRMQYRSRLGIEISFNLDHAGYGIFVTIQPTELKRVLSNLINNSVEAIENTGTVTITLEGTNKEARIIIKDNGKGIPPEILPKLMQRGETHGKNGGSGLGLFHARTSCESWGGRLNLSSEAGRGTEITLTLPCSPAPQWFVPKLLIYPKSRLVILDDDLSIHQIWTSRLEALKQAEIQVFHFSTGSEIEAWSRDGFDPKIKTVFLFDYELLGENTNGLELIEKLRISNQSILVTSRYDELKIRETCKRLGVKLIPKGMAGFVPIKILEPTDPQCADVILIDDDDLVHMTWRYSAKHKGVRFFGFKTAEDFYEIADTIDPDTPIYVDSNLEKNREGIQIRGEDVTLKLSEMGFHEIYLATGLAPPNAHTLTWLKGVRGKDPPY